MSDPRSLLQEALQVAEQELAKAEAAIQQWRDAVEALRKALKAPASNRSRPARPYAPYAEMSGPDAVAAVLRDAREPLPLKSIIERIQAGGYKPDADPASLYTTLYTNLSRGKRFRSLGKARFGLEDGEA